MKINNIGKIKAIPDKAPVEKRDINTPKQDKNTPAAIYIKSKVEDKGHVYDKSEINKLKEASERSYSHLKQMIQDMITRQGKSINILDPKSTITIDETTRNEAKTLISEDGPLGIEAVSDDIVNFAKAISGGDKNKLSQLREAIDKGFKAAEKVLGRLPEISKQTYDKIMEKLDIWEED